MKKITCVVDNAALRGSPFWGEHGLAFRLEIDGVCALFDTGQSGTVLTHNLSLMAPRDASAIIISHAHKDHTGGLTEVLSQKPGLPLYANPDLFRPRFSLKNGEYEPIGLAISQEEMTRLADLRLSDAPLEALPGLWTTGEIGERPEAEGRSERHFIPRKDGWQPDPYRDDLSLVMETQKGLVVICGCCHAGLLNTLAHARQMFRRPIIAVLGGAHLADAGEAHLQRVIEVLRQQYASPRLYLNHCTGERAAIALANAFGNRANPCPAGTTLTFGG